MSNLEVKVQKESHHLITSTLQQEVRKFGFQRDTMSVAQKLYEKGFITYMRTDSTDYLAIIEAAREGILTVGKEYLFDKCAITLQTAQKLMRLSPVGISFCYARAVGFTIES